VSAGTTVSRLSVTAVKGTRLRSVDSVSIGPDGAAGDRRFYLIDERGQMISGTRLGALVAAVADFRDGHLALTLPDGRLVDGEVSLGDPVQTQFFSVSRAARLVEGPFSAALSELAGQPLRLVQADDGAMAVDRGPDGAVTLISRGSLERLSAEAGVPSVDARRFRMLVEVEGIEPHAEDGWIGRTVRIGETQVAFAGNVGRCAFTTRDPETGHVDFKTLHLLRQYRGEVTTTEPLPFGIYGSVVEPGTVRVGDRVSVE
jgi:uncharacterized protein YcbX